MSESSKYNTALLLSAISPMSQNLTGASMKEVTPSQGSSTPIVAGSTDSLPKESVVKASTAKTATSALKPFILDEAGGSDDPPPKWFNSFLTEFQATQNAFMEMTNTSLVEIKNNQIDHKARIDNLSLKASQTRDKRPIEQQQQFPQKEADRKREREELVKLSMVGNRNFKSMKADNASNSTSANLFDSKKPVHTSYVRCSNSNNNSVVRNSNSNSSSSSSGGGGGKKMVDSSQQASFLFIVRSVFDRGNAKKFAPTLPNLAMLCKDHIIHKQPVAGGVLKNLTLSSFVLKYSDFKYATIETIRMQAKMTLHPAPEVFFFYYLSGRTLQPWLGQWSGTKEVRGYTIEPRWFDSGNLIKSGLTITILPCLNVETDSSSFPGYVHVVDISSDEGHEMYEDNNYDDDYIDDNDIVLSEDENCSSNNNE